VRWASLDEVMTSRKCGHVEALRYVHARPVDYEGLVSDAFNGLFDDLINMYAEKTGVFIDIDDGDTDDAVFNNWKIGIIGCSGSLAFDVWNGSVKKLVVEKLRDIKRNLPLNDLDETFPPLLKQVQVDVIRRLHKENSEFEELFGLGFREFVFTPYDDLPTRKYLNLTCHPAKGATPSFEHLSVELIDAVIFDAKTVFSPPKEEIYRAGGFLPEFTYEDKHIYFVCHRPLFKVVADPIFDPQTRIVKVPISINQGPFDLEPEYLYFYTYELLGPVNANVVPKLRGRIIECPDGVEFTDENGNSKIIDGVSLVILSHRKPKNLTHFVVDYIGQAQGKETPRHALDRLTEGHQKFSNVLANHNKSGEEVVCILCSFEYRMKSALAPTFDDLDRLQNQTSSLLAEPDKVVNLIEAASIFLFKPEKNGPLKKEFPTPKVEEFLLSQSVNSLYLHLNFESISVSLQTDIVQSDADHQIVLNVKES
jgi:hypothetical protein